MNLLKTLPKRKVLIFILVGFVFFLGFVFYFNLKSGTKNDLVQLAANTATFYEKDKINSPLPVRLKIPSISVDSTFEYVGLTPGGAMDAPKGPANVGWYVLGPKPGDIGSAVIAGHSGWKNNTPAVFDNLNKLQKGDKIYVENDTGGIATFIVRESRKYNPKADATDVFFSSDSKAHLNLITCTGFWNKILKSRSERLVVFTDKVDSTSPSAMSSGPNGSPQ